jgi:hypothetical protein
LDGTWGRNPFAEPTTFDYLASNNLFYRLEKDNPEKLQYTSQE